MSDSGLRSPGNSRGIKEDQETGRKKVSGIYTFGNFILDRQRGCLFRDGQDAKLRPKSFELLVYFVENHGWLVTKDELIKAVWPDSFVTDDSLVQCVRDIRRAMADSQAHIKTAPRRGYIFEANVIENDPGSKDSDNLVVAGHAPASAEVAARERQAAPPAPARRALLWVGGVLLTLAATLVALALYPSKNLPPVWRAVPLTSYPGLELNPSLSSDGNSVAFSWNGEAQDNFDIYVQPVGSGHPQRLTTDPAQDTSPVWSPAGDKIAFLRRIDGDRNHVVLIPPIGGPEQILAETRMQQWGGNFNSDLRMNLAWTPDGQWVVAGHRESPGGLFLFSVSTGEKRPLTQTPAGYSDENPAFSPDGRAVAFSRKLGGGVSELYLVSLSKDYSPSGPARPITSEGGLATHPAWSNDGNRIFYRFEPGLAVSTGQPTLLRVIDVRSPETPEPILSEFADMNELSLARDLVYSQSVFNPDIWRAEIPSEKSPPSVPHLLISSTRMDNSAQYSPVGKAIAFRSSRSGPDEIWIAGDDGSNPIQLTSFGPGVLFPNWAPNGQRLVFHARPEGHGDIFTVAASGGPARRLTSDPFDDRLASYSRDGRWIYFTSNRSGENEVWKMPADGGEATRVTVGGGMMPVESSDGKSVFFARGSWSIWKVPRDGGEAVQVTGSIAKDAAFAVSKEGIYYVTPPESPTRQLIQFLDFSTNRSRPVVVAGTEIGLGMSLSPDGRYLIFPQRDQVGSDLMIARDFGARN